jgi:hypothetical protein
VSSLIALASGSFDVELDLCLEGLGEHPSGSPASDLVEVEHELFAHPLVLM